MTNIKFWIITGGCSKVCLFETLQVGKCELLKVTLLKVLDITSMCYRE